MIRDSGLMLGTKELMAEAFLAHLPAVLHRPFLTAAGLFPRRPF